MSMRFAVGFAACVALGAWIASDNWILLTSAAVFGLVAFRRLGLCVAGAGVAASLLSSHAWTELDRPVPTELNGIATIASDPERTYDSLRLELDIGGRRYLATTGPELAAIFTGTSSGDRVEVSGVTRPLAGRSAPSLRRKHVAARLQMTDARSVDQAGGIDGVANHLRGLVVAGAAPMEQQNRALYRGLVLGDDRDQSDQQRDEFRDAGIAHLLAVSGQNVAFLLLVMAPVLSLCGRRTRVVVALAALIVFGTVTRWEPSVVRAVVMASVVLVAYFNGRRLDAWRALGLTTGVSLLLDPFLVGSIGFLLSVTACAGMAAFAVPIGARLPGPRWLATGVGVTMAAQIGVAPVQLSVFGPMPLVALLSNLLAGPLAAFVMMWGMTAGIVAGVLGGAASVLISWPSEMAVEGLGAVATFSAARSELSWTPALVACAAGALVALPSRKRDVDDEQPEVGSRS